MAFDNKQWRRLPGSSRQYENIKTGQKVSRRQYDALKGGPQKSSAKAVVRSRPATKRYNSLVRDRVAYLREKGEKTNFNEVRKSAEMKSIISRLKVRKGEDIKDPEVNLRRWNALKETGRIKDHVELYILSL